MNFTRLTPNLLVADVSASLHFYTEILGFTRSMSIPDAEPFVFAAVTAGSLEIFLNQHSTAVAEYPELAARPIGGTLTLYIEVTGPDSALESLLARIQSAGIPILQPLHDQFYGMREFVIADPDGWLLTFAERIPQPVITPPSL